MPQSDLDDGFLPEDEDENGDKDEDAAQLQALIDEEEHAHSRSNQVDDRMLELTTAAIAVEMDETNLAWVLSAKSSCRKFNSLYLFQTKSQQYHR